MNTEEVYLVIYRLYIPIYVPLALILPINHAHGHFYQLLPILTTFEEL